MKSEPGVETELVDGGPGELSVQVDGREVAKKKWLIFKPSIEKVVKAVREAGSASG